MFERAELALPRLRPPLNTWRWDLALAAAIGIASALGLFATGSHVGPLALGMVLVLSLAATLRHRHAVAAALLLCPIILAFGLADDFARENGVLFLGLAVLSYSLGTRPDHGAALLATGCLFVFCQTLEVLSGQPLSPPFLFVTFGSGLVGRIVESRRLLVEQMADREREVSAELETYTALMVRRERARIARDLHDIVAHCVAVMAIQAGAGRLTSAASSAQASGAFRRIRATGSEALSEMQKLVDLLAQADAGAGGRERLDALLQQVRTAGLEVDLIAAAESDVDDTAFRIVQEGLTNALKHAPGAAVTVTLTELDTDVFIEITNARASPSHLRIGFETSRRGLVGVRERVEACGGEMESGALPDGGWRLRVRLPRSDAGGLSGRSPALAANPRARVDPPVARARGDAPRARTGPRSSPPPALARRARRASRHE